MLLEQATSPRKIRPKAGLDFYCIAAIAGRVPLFVLLPSIAEE